MLQTQEVIAVGQGVGRDQFPDRRRFVRTLSIAAATAMLTTGFGPIAVAQAGTNAVVGTWRFVSFVAKYPDGKPVFEKPNGWYGPGASGYLMLDANGRFIMAIIGDRPKFVGKSRREGTPEEMAAVVTATEVIYGTYTASDQEMIAKVEKAIFPNWDGGERKWGVSIEGDELRMTFPLTPSAGGSYIPSAVWKRVR